MFAARVTAVAILLTAFDVTGSGHTADPGAKLPTEVGRSRADEPKAVTPARSPEWVRDQLNAVDVKLDGEAKDLVALYQHLHANPELSLLEEKTAARLADEMRKLGFEVTEKVGLTGVVCVLKNGPGPVVLFRTDIDALPIIEQTGVPYASK